MQQFVETLEDRRLFALTITFDPDWFVLNIVGDNDNDTVNVTVSPDNDANGMAEVSVNGNPYPDDCEGISIDTGEGFDIVTLNLQARLQGDAFITVNGGPQGDSITLETAVAHHNDTWRGAGMGTIILP